MVCWRYKDKGSGTLGGGGGGHCHYPSSILNPNTSKEAGFHQCSSVQFKMVSTHSYSEKPICAALCLSEVFPVLLLIDSVYSSDSGLSSASDQNTLWQRVNYICLLAGYHNFEGKTCLFQSNKQTAFFLHESSDKENRSNYLVCFVRMVQRRQRNTTKQAKVC